MSMNLDLDQTALLELKNELNQIDQRLTDLTRVPIVSFSDEDDDFNDEEQEERDYHRPSSSSSTSFSKNNGVIVRARRGRAQVLHTLSTSRGAVLASKSLLSTFNEHRQSFETATTSNHFIHTLLELLNDIQRDSTLQDGNASTTLNTRHPTRTPVLIPWQWIHLQNKTSTNIDLCNEDVTMNQIKKGELI